jgi:excisionase family DNA binding protein
MKTIEALEQMHQALTVKELAKILGDSPAHIYRRIHNGEIEGVFRDGRHIKICPAAFVEWLKKQIVKGSCPRKKNLKASPGGRSRYISGVASAEANHQSERSQATDEGDHKL